MGCQVSAILVYLFKRYGPIAVPSPWRESGVAVVGKFQSHIATTKMLCFGLWFYYSILEKV